ncbi:hypothetical protein M406DRAFT_330101 [Cryphonectria parasitica EP155]|uniref:Uncharacterized protein n=1 Tax=Cryphonectria parasitica (strain ATCC 38755 / EP155) TaxID=660469 RepID=A0A9P4Y3H7_CRYP1|nr:uncharacterized protein M406DRAFT_330101 [Cryphonectria parasitica EP155]KAF3766269.1 hypothetical protein M406DRAFT_330101 [Cryphonectria parasitica EP155]
MATPETLAEKRASKEVQEPVKWGYEVKRRSPQSNGSPLIYSITHPEYKDIFGKINGEIDVFRYSAEDEGSLDIVCAWNGLDERARHEKLSLRQLLLGFWKFTLGHNPRDLKQITYVYVQETSLTNLIIQIYNKMGAGLFTDLLISSGDEEVFQMIANGTPFGNGAQQMLSEYDEFAGVQIESFQFIWEEGENYPDFIVKFK